MHTDQTPASAIRNSIAAVAIVGIVAVVYMLEYRATQREVAMLVVGKYGALQEADSASF